MWVMEYEGQVQVGGRAGQVCVCVSGDGGVYGYLHGCVYGSAGYAMGVLGYGSL